jgi:hypothetical protein
MEKQECELICLDEIVREKLREVVRNLRYRYSNMQRICEWNGTGN